MTSDGRACRGNQPRLASVLLALLLGHAPMACGGMHDPGNPRDQFFSPAPVTTAREVVLQLAAKHPGRSRRPSQTEALSVQTRLPAYFDAGASTGLAVSPSAASRLGFAQSDGQTRMPPNDFVFLRDQALDIRQLNSNGHFVGHLFDGTQARASVFSWPANEPPTLLRTLDAGTGTGMTFSPTGIDDQDRVVGIAFSGNGLSSPGWIDANRPSSTLQIPKFAGNGGEFRAISKATGQIAGIGGRETSCCHEIEFSLTGLYSAPMPGPSLGGGSFPCFFDIAPICGTTWGQPAARCEFGLDNKLVAVNDGGEAVGFSAWAPPYYEAFSLANAYVEDHVRAVYVRGGSIRDLNTDFEQTPLAQSIAQTCPPWAAWKCAPERVFKPYPSGINNQGIIVGWTTLDLPVDDPSGAWQTWWPQPFRIDRAGAAPQPLPRTSSPDPYYDRDLAWWPIAINNNGYILGQVKSVQGDYGVVWKPDGTWIRLDFPVWSGGINDSNQVVASGCGIGSYGFYCLLAKWDLEPRLVVELSAEPNVVVPVESGYFDAVTQDWEGTRLDLVDLKVRAYLQGNSHPLQGAMLTLSSVAELGSGAHPSASHDGKRPNGTFWRVGEDPNMVPGHRNSITIPVAAIEATYPYLTSGVSGTEHINATLRFNGQTAVASTDVTIRYGGLEAMPRSGSTYSFTHQNGSGPQRHGDVNNYLQPGFARSVMGVFQFYFDHVAEPKRFLGGSTGFEITEGSLEFGGLLDVGNDPWRNPHQTHRMGHDLDLRYPAVRDREKFSLGCSRNHIRCQVHCNTGIQLSRCTDPSQRHYHLLP